MHSRGRTDDRPAWNVRAESRRHQSVSAAATSVDEEYNEDENRSESSSVVTFLVATVPAAASKRPASGART